MTVQKFIKYNSLDINGQVLNDEHKLELNVLEKSGNYLIHKDILRHQISKNKVLFLLKLEVKFVVVVENLGVKKVLVEHVQVLTVHRYGKVVVLFLDLNQKKLF